MIARDEDDMSHHHHEHGHEHYTSSRKKRFALTIFFNIIITATEYAGGILSGSLALLSDATHNLSDVLALVFGYMGERVSEKKPDLDYSFGLKRFEVITAVINALALCGIGVFILFAAIQRWRNPVVVNLGIMLPIAFVGLTGNILSLLVLGRKDASLNVRAAFLHLLYDAFSSLAVIATGMLMLYTHILWLDPLISIFIVIMIGVSSFDIILEALRIILQVAPKDVDTNDVYSSIIETSGARDVHGLHIWSVNSSEVFLSCHLCMEQNREELDTDWVVRQVNAMLAEKFGITHTTIQVEAGRFCIEDNQSCCNTEKR